MSYKSLRERYSGSNTEPANSNDEIMYQHIHKVYHLEKWVWLLSELCKHTTFKGNANSVYQTRPIEYWNK